MAKKLREQKGVALIASIGISLMLMLVAIAVAYRVGLFTQRTSMLEKKDQLVFTGDFGLETLRYYLWNRYCIPPDWCGAISDVNQTQYINYIQKVQTEQYAINNNLRFTDIFQNQQTEIKDSDNNTAATITHQIEGTTNSGLLTIDWTNPQMQDLTYRYKIYTRSGNTPDILYAMVSSVRIQPGEGQEEQILERSTVETALYFSVPCPEDYKQFGQCKSKEGASSVGGITPSMQQLL